MRNIFINDAKRLWQYRPRLVTLFVMIFCGIAVALYFGDSGTTTLKIAAVGFKQEALGTANQGAENTKLQVAYLTKKPSRTSLVEGLYDAILTQKETGEITVTSLKSQAFETQLLQLLKNPNEKITAGVDTRQIDEKILGYLMLFFLMSCITTTFLFPEEKERGMLSRIAATNFSLSKLVLSHGLMVIFLLTIPTVAMIYFGATIFQVTLHFSIGQWGFLIALLALLGVSLGLFLVTITPDGDSANMLGTLVVMVTTLLSGSFFTIAPKHVFVTQLLRFLPQKQMLEIAAAFRAGNFWWENSWRVGFVLCVAVGLFILTCWRTKSVSVLNS